MTSWGFLYIIALTGSWAGEQLGVKSSSLSSCWMLYYSPQCSLFSPYAIELTCISNRDQICKHCQAGCNCCQVLEVIDDVVTGPYSRSGWALVLPIAAPWYCYLFTAKNRASFQPFCLSPAAKNIFTLHQEKMNSCLQDLYSLLCAIWYQPSEMCKWKLHKWLIKAESCLNFFPV